VLPFARLEDELATDDEKRSFQSERLYLGSPVARECSRRLLVLLVWECEVIVVELGDGELRVRGGFFSEICLNSRAKGPVMMFRIEAGHKSQSRVEDTCWFW
jgi:hypothetical protein